MFGSLSTVLNPEFLQNFFSGAVQSEFLRTCLIFALAAFVHARQVRVEIRAQFAELVEVLREDLEAQKSVLAGLAIRVNNIEARLNTKL